MTLNYIPRSIMLSISQKFRNENLARVQICNNVNILLLKVEKNNFVVMQNRTNEEGVNIKLDCKDRSRVKSYKFLGITFDETCQLDVFLKM